MDDLNELRRMTIDPGHEELIEDLRDEDGRVVVVVARVAKCGEPPKGSKVERTVDAVIYHLAPGERRDVKELYRTGEGAQVRIKLVAHSCDEPPEIEPVGGRSATGSSSGTIVSAPWTGDGWDRL